MGNHHKDSHVFLIGSGIASLASAVYFIKDGGIPGSCITLFEESNKIGGCLDAQGSAHEGYSMRGARMFTEEAYTLTYDLLSQIPSLSNANKSVTDEIFEFNRQVKSHSKCRLVEKGKKINFYSTGLNWRHRFELMKVVLRSESSLSDSKIEDHFASSFFKTNFWLEWATTFAFQPWHSAVEFRRYAFRFVQEFYRLATLGGVKRTPYNQYDAIVLPVVKWLKENGVNFEINSKVTSVQFTDNKKAVIGFDYLKDGMHKKIDVKENDFVLITIGSMVSNSNLGSMNSAPSPEMNTEQGSFELWKNIANHTSDFGNPSVFCNRIDESKWESYTITFRDPTFYKLMVNFSGNEPGTGGLVTFKDSNWLLSVVIYHHPHLLHQPQNVEIAWGYGLYPDQPGNFVKKKMSECTGEEILVELCQHLGFEEQLPFILKNSTCIPCMMPFVTSQFLTRKNGDRPKVVPDGVKNFAFIGQYCEIPKDIVFTVDYSVRSAQIAVYTLLKLNKKVMKPYQGIYHPKVLLSAMRTFFN